MKLRFIILLAVIFCLVLAGCGAVENLKLFKSETPEPEAAPEIPAEETPPAQEESLAAGLPETASGEEETPEEPPVENGRQVVLYFANSDKSSLEAETRTIPNQEGIARATINQLIAGPKQKGLSPTLPASTILEGINISDGVCTVDFSTDFVEFIAMDSQSQLLSLYSVVNTLTQFDTVDYVRILVDGESLSLSLGGVDVSQALAPVDL